MKRALKGDGTLRQRPDGRWEYRVVVGLDADGKVIRKSFYSTDKSGRGAKNKYKEWLEGKEKPIESKQTVKMWAERWLETYKKGRVAPQSYRNYRMYVDKHIVPALGHFLLSDVKPVQIQGLYASKGDLSDSALNHIRIALNGIFNSAVDNGLCSINPAAKIRPQHHSDHDPQVFTREEVSTLLAACKNHPDGVYVEALLYTGLRIGELCALMWSDVDLDRGILTISKSASITGDKGRKYQVKNTTKTGHTRQVVLTPEGTNLFQRIPRKGLYVFTGDRTDFCSPDTYRRRYDRVFEGLEIRHLSPHKCRHTYATFLLDAGASIRSVQDQLGHSRITTTEIYTHVDLDARRQNVDKLVFDKKAE